MIDAAFAPAAAAIAEGRIPGAALGVVHADGPEALVELQLAEGADAVLALELVAPGDRPRGQLRRGGRRHPRGGQQRGRPGAADDPPGNQSSHGHPFARERGAPMLMEPATATQSVGPSETHAFGVAHRAPPNRLLMQSAIRRAVQHRERF